MRVSAVTDFKSITVVPLSKIKVLPAGTVMSEGPLGVAGGVPLNAGAGMGVGGFVGLVAISY